ncbi:MAG: polymerase primary sigma factor, partial [Paraburkholderia sp.]|nr:polymerase primary sigma factor [Paraburkholderia sp.]
MAKTTGAKATTAEAGKAKSLSTRTGSSQAVRKLSDAKAALAGSATGRKSASNAAVRASTAAAEVTKAAKASAKPETRSAAKQAGSKSGRGVPARPDNSAVRETQVSTVQPAEVQQPRVENIAGTANSMTKKLNEVSVDDDATQGEEQQAAPGKAEKVKARDRRAKEKALLKDAFASTQPGTAEELEERRAKLRA